jgi:nucleotide-binding universal stress UspA family protein
MVNLVENSNRDRLDLPPSPPPPSIGPLCEPHPIRRILACVDRSALSEVCLRYAIAVSKSLGSAITLLYVMQPPQERPGEHATGVVEWEIARQEAVTYMDRLAREGTAALEQPVDTRLEQGHPAERITAVAQELDADLAVLGSHGERGKAAWTLGSTALQVLALARGSVLIARPNASGDGAVSPKRVLVPLDGSLRAESVLPTAARIAKKYGANLLLILVVREPVATAVLHTQEDLEAARALANRLEANGKGYLEGLGDQLVREGASVRTLVLRHPDERQCLLELSQKEGTDLIVLSAHGATCNSELPFGSVTTHLLTHSVVPLFVLQDLRRSERRGNEPEGSAPPLRASYAAGSV